MPAPKKPNIEPARQKRLLKGDATAARRLRAHGYLVFGPQVLALLPAEAVQRLRILSEQAPPEQKPEEGVVDSH
jgi:hypothetical protein